MACYLLRHEGLFVGPSAALNVVGAVKAARELGEGKVVATVVCDGGDRYRGGFWHEKTCKACESCTAASGDLAPCHSMASHAVPAPHPAHGDDGVAWE